ncbi:glycosyl transferase [Spirosoma linguale]|uniref:Glycosyltransferase n=1 Tax=Spirosoma linguale (strain ATCC 33905 / DSM 74 / LMG 10896 / Claus 1) TaxID=504472 RepID=D2QLP3_SPILD|nr:glycosyltransferase [Spirosoma linguale DSM 74]
MNAPVILFAFKRPHELKATIQALEANYLAPESDLYIFADAPKRPEDWLKVNEVRQLLDGISGFRTIHRDYAQTNIGCADSVIRGISYVLSRHPTAIIVEDDLITSPNFLDFMNQGLRQYALNRRVYSVAGYTFPFQKPRTHETDAYMIPRHSPWGWATWADRWASIDWDMKAYPAFMQDKQQQKAFMQGGSDLLGMLRDQMEGRADAWDIRFCFNRFNDNGLTVYPTKSKVQNIGFGEEATHTNIYNRYKTDLDDGTQRTFTFPRLVQTTDYYHQQTLRRYSVPIRIFNRLKTIAGMR